MITPPPPGEILIDKKKGGGLIPLQVTFPKICRKLPKNRNIFQIYEVSQLKFSINEGRGRLALQRTLRQIRAKQGGGRTYLEGWGLIVIRTVSKNNWTTFGSA